MFNVFCIFYSCFIFYNFFIIAYFKNFKLRMYHVNLAAQGLFTTKFLFWLRNFSYHQQSDDHISLTSTFPRITWKDINFYFF